MKCGKKKLKPWASGWVLGPPLRASGQPDAQVVLTYFIFALHETNLVSRFIAKISVKPPKKSKKPDHTQKKNARSPIKTRRRKFRILWQNLETCKLPNILKCIVKLKKNLNIPRNISPKNTPLRGILRLILMVKNGFTKIKLDFDKIAWVIHIWLKKKTLSLYRFHSI